MGPMSGRVLLDRSPGDVAGAEWGRPGRTRLRRRDLLAGAALARRRAPGPVQLPGLRGHGPGCGLAGRPVHRNARRAHVRLPARGRAHAGRAGVHRPGRTGHARGNPIPQTRAAAHRRIRAQGVHLARGRGMARGRGRHQLEPPQLVRTQRDLQPPLHQRRGCRAPGRQAPLPPRPGGHRPVPAARSELRGLLRIPHRVRAADLLPGADHHGLRRSGHLDHGRDLALQPTARRRLEPAGIRRHGLAAGRGRRIRVAQVPRPGPPPEPPRVQGAPAPVQSRPAGPLLHHGQGRGRGRARARRARVQAADAAVRVRQVRRPGPLHPDGRGHGGRGRGPGRGPCVPHRPRPPGPRRVRPGPGPGEPGGRADRGAPARAPGGPAPEYAPARGGRKLHRGPGPGARGRDRLHRSRRPAPLARGGHARGALRRQGPGHRRARDRAQERARVPRGGRSEERVRVQLPDRVRAPGRLVLLRARLSGRRQAHGRGAGVQPHGGRVDELRGGPGRGDRRPVPEHEHHADPALGACGRSGGSFPGHRERRRRAEGRGRGRAHLPRARQPPVRERGREPPVWHSHRAQLLHERPGHELRGADRAHPARQAPGARRDPVDHDRVPCGPRVAGGVRGEVRPVPQVRRAELPRHGLLPVHRAELAVRGRACAGHEPGALVPAHHDGEPVRGQRHRLLRRRGVQPAPGRAQLREQRPARPGPGQRVHGQRRGRAALRDRLDHGGQLDAPRGARPILRAYEQPELHLRAPLALPGRARHDAPHPVRGLLDSGPRTGRPVRPAHARLVRRHHHGAVRAGHGHRPAHRAHRPPAVPEARGLPGEPRPAGPVFRVALRQAGRVLRAGPGPAARRAHGAAVRERRAHRGHGLLQVLPR